MSQASDLLMLDSNDLNFLDQLGEPRHVAPSYEPTPEPKHQAEMYIHPTASSRVEPVLNTPPVQMVKQEPIQPPTSVIAPEQNLYRMEPPKEKPVEMYRSDIRPPTFVEPPKEKPVEVYRGYPTLEAPVVSSPAPVYTPSYAPKVQQQYMQQQQMPTIQLPSTQQMNQITQSQQNLASIHTMSSQHLQQTKEMVVKFESYFDRMVTWMESIDKRLSRLEVTTNELQKNQQTLQQKLNSTPSHAPSMVPSMVPYFLPPQSTTSVPTASAHEALPISTYELETATKMQQTLDSDAELAKKLQAEFETETKKKTETPKIVQEECPVCQKKVNSKEFNDHVNECLDKASKDDKAVQSGFFSRFFKKTETPTPAPEKAEVPLAKKPTGTTATQSQTQTQQMTPPPMYPTFPPYMMPQATQGKPNGTATPTPYFFPQPYPFQQGQQQQQPMYYFPQGYPFQQGQPQPQPKK